MMVLVDSSVWVEFFRSRPSIDMAPLSIMIEERRVATCLPIRAEVLSGRMSEKTRSMVGQAFASMTYVDLDWSAGVVWEEMVELARKAHHHKVSLPGIVDRMLLLAALKSGVSLWTLDGKLKTMASLFKIDLFSS